MKRISLLFTGLVALLVSLSLRAEKIPPPPAILDQSQQLVVVTADDWNTSSAALRCYARNNAQAPWKRVGTKFDVVVGKNGMGWGVPFSRLGFNGPIKKEGDNRAPAGIFPFGNAFGFTSTAPSDLKLNYTPITPTTFCVDDRYSKYYNQIVDTAQIKKPDWKSGEQMRQIPGYFWGTVIDYNSTPPSRGYGSCVFMHIWKGPDIGTAGCIAMSEEYIEQMLSWLDQAKKPLIVILPESQYNNLQAAWKLPPLASAKKAK